MEESSHAERALYMANYGWCDVTQATIVRQHNFDEENFMPIALRT